MKKQSDILTVRNIIFATVSVLALLIDLIAMGFLIPFIVRPGTEE